MHNTRKFLVLSTLLACGGEPFVEPRPNAMEGPVAASTPVAHPLPSGPLQALASGVPGVTYAWTERTDVFVPRVVAAIADQPNRKRVLAYGGWQENGVRGDTWEWDGFGWIHRHPLHDPGRRAVAASVYDEERQRVLLFSGADEFFPAVSLSNDADTWAWDGHDWSSLSTVNHPPPLMGPAATWDPIGKRMLVFGGFGAITEATDDAGVFRAQTNGTDGFWAFDGFDWKELPRTDPWPPPRGLSSMTWDRVRNRLVLTSGQKQAVFEDGLLSFGKGDGSSFAAPIADTWEWDGATWTLIPAAPILQVGNASTFFDPVANEVRLVADEIIDGIKIGPVLRRYLDGNWVEMSRSAETDEARIITSVGWSSANQAPLLFAGGKLSATGTPSSDVSLLEEIVGDVTWQTQPRSTQLVPLERAVAATRSDGTIVLFGGLSGSQVQDQTLRWNGGRWVSQSPDHSPPARWSAAMSRLGLDRLVLHGGLADDGALLGDTWTYDGDWTQSPGDGPSPRKDAVLFPIGAAATLYGGQAGSGLTDTWRYQDDAWTQLAPTTNPGVRAQPCAVSDGTLGVLAGSSKDVWTFDGTTWAFLQPTFFGQRSGCAAAVLMETGQNVLRGGNGAEASPDLAEITPRVLALLDVTENLRVDPPVRRRGAVFSSNPLTGGAILAGGLRSDNDTQLADTWQLRALGQACTADDTCGKGAFCTEGVCCEQSSCGPCETCGGPGHPGLCEPRAAGAYPGCDGAYACNTEGQCRLGAGGACAESDSCATGACVKAGDAGAGTCCGIEGCAVACADDYDQRNPDGTVSSCAPFACGPAACRTTCSSTADCAPNTYCTAAGACVANGQSAPGDESGGCGCHVAGAPTGLVGGGFGSFALGLLAVLRRRQRKPAASTTTE